MRAGFSAHPYHPEVMADYGEDEEAQYELINDVGGAQYYFPTPGDSDTLRPGGLADETLDVVINVNTFLDKHLFHIPNLFSDIYL